jgi:ATP-dependent Clp protease ATP-binding subunit ClpC
MRYSRRAQLAIRLASQEAARLDHDHVGTGHLLLGLVREGEGAAIAFLKDAKVDLEKMKAELESIKVEALSSASCSLPAVQMTL